MKHQVINSNGGGASVPARPTRASRAAAPAVVRRPARARGNLKDEKKLESESEALRREVERLRRRNDELEQQLALAHRTVDQLRQQQATALVDMYYSLTTNTKTANAAASGIIGELQNRSTHLLADYVLFPGGGWVAHAMQIKGDVEEKAGLINHLIAEVHQTTFADVEQVLAFVDWLDQHLSTLSDETAVLKHFSWPERKADALREAAFKYRNLNSLLTQISNSSNDTALASCEATLTKASALQHKYT
ncbi:hypothetical protein E2562_033752 [Oryza meyeriana var. granulata]|uniref:Uncharacterized protein n=1 Tax=Oryza meyeriana var. granulata TaxID=110450 RepID=A0A6G1F0Z4_9ORYZ|nr:hypothetical protein E2562_033752 [Oryza meyeriana var. granulata]